jgi:tetratricopeptide (TPR) repeat protein
MAEGDPRFIGYAEAALRPWGSKDPPHDVLVLRARLRQYRHDFAGALDDLAAAAASNASDPEVWLWRAAILLVQADYAGAASACEALRETGQTLDWVGCKTSVDAVTGRAGSAYAELSESLARTRGARAGTKVWMLTRLGEFSLVLDQADRAEGHFKEALALANDEFLLAAYADFCSTAGAADVVAPRRQPIWSCCCDGAESDLAPALDNHPDPEGPLRRRDTARRQAAAAGGGALSAPSAR